MKKKLCSIVCLCCFVSIMLCACGRKEQGNPIRLPAREDIVSIGISDGDKYAMSPNTEGEATEFIDEFLSMLMDMETTSQQSINDAPVNKDSITININCDGAAGTTLFYYVDKGIEYVEQPYQGIYKPTPALGNCITEMLATVYKGNIIKNLIMDCQSYTKYRPNETTGGIFVSWRRKEELPTGA